MIFFEGDNSIISSQTMIDMIYVMDYDGFRSRFGGDNQIFRSLDRYSPSKSSN